MRSLPFALTLVATLTQTPATARPGLVVSLEWLSSHLKDPNVVIIATGEPQNYVAGHIPGARYLGHGETLNANHRLLGPEALAAVLTRAGARDAAHVVVYGHPMETGWLYMAFASIGHGDRFSILDGNLEAWRRGKLPIDAVAVPDGRGRLTPKPSPDVIVDATYVRERLRAAGESARYAGVQARVYVGSWQDWSSSNSNPIAR